MKLKLQIVSPLLLAALAVLPSEANAQRQTAGQTAELCILNTEGARLSKLTMDSLFVRVLSSSLPERYAAVQAQEDCSDPRDNNCDGEVNEGCSEEPSIWNAGPDCEACMVQECAAEVEACEGSEICENIVSCSAQEQCLDTFLGSLGCLCGEGVTVAQCQNMSENELGPCAQELRAQYDYSAPPGPWGPRVIDDSGSKVLICLGRKCQSECTELIYND